MTSSSQSRRHQNWTKNQSKQTLFKISISRINLMCRRI